MHERGAYSRSCVQGVRIQASGCQNHQRPKDRALTQVRFHHCPDAGGAGTRHQKDQKRDD